MPTFSPLLIKKGIKMIDKKFIINLQGNNFILFEGLLNEFHKNGGEKIETKIVSQEPLIIQATVSGKKGTYQGIGDADDTNVNRMIVKHKIRMAETRAIARALRWYNNVGMCSAEELGGDDIKTRQNANKGEIDTNKQWLNITTFDGQQTEKYDEIKKQFENHTYQEVLEMAKKKYKVSRKTEDQIKDIYREYELEKNDTPFDKDLEDKVNKIIGE